MAGGATTTSAAIQFAVEDRASSKLRAIGSEMRDLGKLGGESFGEAAKASGKVTTALGVLAKRFDFVTPKMLTFGVAVAGAVGALVLLSRRMISVIDEGQKFAQAIGVTSQKLGVSTDALQRFQVVAERIGDVSAEKVTAGLQSLSKASADSAIGLGKNRVIFARLGIDAEAFVKSGKPILAMLPVIADKIRAIESPAERAQISMRLFGEAGAELTPILALGGDEIDRLTKGVSDYEIVSAAAIKQAALLDDTQDELTRRMDVLGTEVASLASGPMRAIKEAIAAVTPIAIDLFRVLWDGTGIVGKMAHAFAGNLGGMLALATGQLSAAKEAFLQVYKDLAEIPKLIWSDRYGRNILGFPAPSTEPPPGSTGTGPAPDDGATTGGKKTEQAKEEQSQALGFQQSWLLGISAQLRAEADLATQHERDAAFWARTEQKKMDLFIEHDKQRSEIEDKARADREAARAARLNEAADMMATATRIGDAMGEIIAAVAKQQMTAIEGLRAAFRAIVSIAIAAARDMILAYMVQSMASASSDAFKKFGLLGFAVAGAAVAAVAALFQGLMGKLHEGGFVPGADRSRDSVPTMLTPGEYVMSTGEVAGVQKFLGRMGAGDEPRRATSRPIQINVSTIDGSIPDGAALERLAKKIARSIQDLDRRGVAYGAA